MKNLRTMIAAALALALAVPASADVTVTLRPGDWTDVLPHPNGGFVQVRHEAGAIVGEWNGRETFRGQLPETSLYLRGAVDNTGRVLTVSQGQSNAAWALFAGLPPINLGVSFGQNAVAAWFDGTRFIVFVQRSPTAADKVVFSPLLTVERVEPFALPATSQGFRDVTPAGELRLGDAFFRTTLRGYHLHQPIERGDAWAGQWSHPPDGAVVVLPDRAFTAYAGLIFEPHLARQGAVLAIAGRTPRGAALAIVTPPYPPNEAPQVDTPPDEDKKPEDDKTPEPQTRIAPNRQSVVADVIRAHPEINSCDEIARAALVDYAAQRLNRAEGREVWGRKSRGKPNHAGIASNPNTDGLTFLRPDGKFEIYDVISGAPPCGAAWDGFGPFAPGENGWWAPPQLGPEPGPGSGGDTPPPGEVEKLKARIAELERQLAEANVQLEEFRNLHAREWARIDELEKERDQLQAERDDARRERDALLAQPEPSCEAKVPGWLRGVLRIGCRIVR